MRLANGSGSVHKMTGNRRKKWRVRITTGWVLDPYLMKYKQTYKDLGYYATRNEALKALMDYNNDPFDLDTLTVTLDDCYQQAKKQFTESRKRNYFAAYKFLTPLKDKPIRSIKAPMMQKCIDSCKTTQQQEVKTLLHKIYNYALEMEIVDKNPSLHLKSNSVSTTINRNIFTSEEIADIEKCDTWWKVCLACLLYSGMRSMELRTLEADDIDLDEMTINIRQAKNKSSVRKIPIHTHAEGFFRQYKDEGLGFYGKSHNGFNKAIQKYFPTEHHGHDTRHTFTTRMRECGADPLILQKLLGHTPQTITERVYTHITLDEMRKNIELLFF